MSMYIRELTIQNFKGFSGEHKLKFDKNLSFFVGNNNSGKSSVFEAIDFLKSGLGTSKSLDDIKTKGSSGHVAVTIKLQDDIRSVISDFSESKYLAYVFDEDEIETMLVRRTSERSKVKQGKKEVEISVKKITLWNPATNQFENPSGIDTTFKTLLETQFVWADTNPDDVTDFGSTKICGRLLTAAIGDFFESEQWENFTTVHEQTFHGGKDSLSMRTKALQKDVQDILTNQYGAANIKFNFELPEPSNFIKSGGINIDDGTDTSSKEKGTGMQRALALALIQVYADQLCKHPEDPAKTKPLFLFIDEPETFLHPSAQQTLLTALDTIAAVRQVIVTTHSPYLLRSFDDSLHQLFIFSKDSAGNSAKPVSALNLFGTSSPTWGEINYYAYNMPTVEFHNELFGFVQAKATTIDANNEREPSFDNFLNSQGIAQDQIWIRQQGGAALPGVNRTIQTYIRNTIHHPENGLNSPFTDDQLRQSTEALITVLQSMP